MTKAKAIDSIVIVGRRWFQKSYGNTYHTADVFVNGQLVHQCDEEYGYGDQYEHTAFMWLKDNGYLEGFQRHENGSWDSPRLYCEKNGIGYSKTVTDVNREKDL